MANQYTQNQLTQEQKDFIIANRYNCSYNDLIKLFNERFNINVTYHQIRSFCLGKNLPYKRYSNKGHRFSQEEIEWVKDKYLNTLDNIQEIADEFNKTFQPTDKIVSGYNISDLMTKRMHIKRGTNKGRFGQGINDKKHAAIGTIMSEVKYSNTSSYVRIKVSDKQTADKGYNAYYMPYHKYVYEQAYGPLQEGEFIIFADGNTHNFDLENLIKVNRQINGSLSTKKIQGKGKLTKAFVECKKLEEIINQISK